MHHAVRFDEQKLELRCRFAGVSFEVQGPGDVIEVHAATQTSKRGEQKVMCFIELSQQWDRDFFVAEGLYPKDCNLFLPDAIFSRRAAVKTCRNERVRRESCLGHFLHRGFFRHCKYIMEGRVPSLLKLSPGSFASRKLNC